MSHGSVDMTWWVEVGSGGRNVGMRERARGLKSASTLITGHICGHEGDPGCEARVTHHTGKTHVQLSGHARRGIGHLHDGPIRGSNDVGVGAEG